MTSSNVPVVMLCSIAYCETCSLVAVLKREGVKAGALLLILTSLFLLLGGIASVEWYKECERDVTSW